MAILSVCRAFRTFNAANGLTLMRVTSGSSSFNIGNKQPDGSYLPYGNALLFISTGGADIAFNLGVDASVFVAPGLGYVCEGGQTLLLDELEPAVTSATYIAAMTLNHGTSTAIVMRGTTGRFMAWVDEALTLNPNDPAYGNNNALLGPYYGLGTPSRP